MWTVIIELLAKFGIFFLGKWVESDKAGAEAKRKWLSFIESMAGQATASPRIRKSIEAQRKRILNRLDKTPGTL